MRRLNVKLTLWLIGIGLVSVVGVHFLHGYQLERNADFLKVQAEKANASGHAKEAIKQYNQYLKYRDDEQGYSALAALVVGLAQETDATRQDKVRAYSILQEAIRRHPDLADVRRRLVDYTISMRAFGEALDHIKYLNEHNEKDASLDLKVVQCYLNTGENEAALKKLYEIVGYDEATRQFKPERVEGAKEIDAFDLLASLILKGKDMTRADDVMNKSVEWNPDSAKAHLQRANYLQRTAADRAKEAAQRAGQKAPPAEQDEVGKQAFEKTVAETYAQARADLDRAYELAPNDVDVLVTLAGVSINQKDYVRAKELLDTAIKQDAKRADIYIRLMQMAAGQQDMKAAAGYLQDGVKQASDPQTIYPFLVPIQISLNDLDGARASLKDMQDRGTFSPDFLKYFGAQVKLADGDFGQAVREMEMIRPAIARAAGPTNYLQQLDASMARCYEALGQPDRQLAVYRRLLETAPDDFRFRLGEAAALQALGRFDEADNDLKLLAANLAVAPGAAGMVLQLLISDQARKPAADRDWAEVDRVANMIQENPERRDLEKVLLTGELELLKGAVSKDTEKNLVAATKEHPKDARVWLSLLKILSRDNPANVARLLGRAEKEAGDLAPLRAERLRLILRERGDNAVEDVKKLEENLDKFTPKEQATLLTQLGAAYLQLASYENAARCWKNVIDRDRNNAGIRQLLVELAIDHHDMALAKSTVDGLRDMSQWGPQSALYQYCAAATLLAPLNRQAAQAGAPPLSDADREVLAKAKKLVEEALSSRREWSALWRVRGEIDQLEGNFDGAIEDYKRALEYNQSGQSVIARRLVNLLYRRGRFSEADDALKFAGEIQSADPLHKMSQQIMAKTGDAKRALEMAAEDVKSDPKNTANLLWYARLLEQENRSDDAERVYRRATTISPDSVEAWLMLVRVLIVNKKAAEAAEAVREASKSLEKNDLALAKLNELISDSQEAEKHYKAAVAEHPEDLNVIRQLAEYYFRTAQIIEGLKVEGTQNAMANAAREKYIQRLQLASPLLEKILKTANPSKKPDDVALASWARRAQAEIIAAPADYEHAEEAAALINKNAKDGKLQAEDILALLAMFVNRPDVQSRIESIGLFEKLRELRPLTAGEQFSLGQLYERTGKWPAGKELIVNALSLQGNDPSALIKFITMLVTRGELDDAARWLDKLDELLSKASLRAAEAFRPTAGELRARLLAKTGQEQQAVAVLDSVIPRPLSTGQLPRLEEVARILEELKLYDAAEKLLNEYMSQDPRGTIAVAAFTGRRGNVDRAFQLLEDARKNQSVGEILPCGLDALRRHPDKATPARYQLLEQWANAGLQTEPDPVQIKLLLAELYDLQGRYDEVIKTYRELLNSKDSSPVQSAIVKNNLAFVLAINQSSENANEAMQLTEQAIRVMGPISDLLDTRALAYLAQGKTSEAVADLTVATSETPPAANKLFHLAQAQRQAKNLEAAKAALSRAKEAGIDPNRLTPLERKSFQQLETEFN
jgi:tetratricopeptide (TPR) repeat protein